jgi:predicted permease
MEGLLLSAAGALLGFPAAAWTSRALVNIVWTGYVPLTLDPAPDWRTTLFTACTVITAGVLFGLAPAWASFRIGAGDALRQNSRSVRGGPHRFGRVLLACQTALALLLAITAFQFVRTLHNLRTGDAGFDHKHILVIQLFPQTAHGKVMNQAVYYRRLAEELSHVPGVETVSYSNSAPVSSYEWPSTATTSGISVPIVREPVAPEFFAAMGMRVVSGRDFTWADDARAPLVAVITENLARRLFPKVTAPGQMIDIGKSSPINNVRIVGVVPDAALWKPRSGRPLAVYTPLLQNPDAEDFQLVIRAASDPRALIRPAQRLIESLGQHYSLRTQTAEERMDVVLFQERAIAMLATFFGVVAVVLASIGIYGLLSYSVAVRTPEIGVRMALGARQVEVAGLVLREAMSLVAAGIAAGILLALAGSRLFATLFFGVSAADPWSIASMTAVMSAIALLAGSVPAVRAARTDPAASLRSE